MDKELSELVGKLQLVLNKDKETVVKALQYFLFTGVFTVNDTTTVQRYQALTLIDELSE